MVRLTLSHVVAFLPLLINQFVSGESYNTRLLHDGSNICRVHIHNQSSSTFKKYDVKENASLLAPSGSEMESHIIPSTNSPRRRSELSANCFSSAELVSTLRGGAASSSVSIAAFNPFPSGYHPFGYGITDLGR